MKLCDYTVDEIRSSLQRSNVSTLITEGRDDYTLFRGIGIRIGAVDLLPAGGKHNVLSLRQDKHTFSCPRCVFLVDRDLWLFTGVPAGSISHDLIITDGYSIENDLLRDGKVEKLLDDIDVGPYQADLHKLVIWYCTGVTARLDGYPFDFDKSISSVIDTKGNFTPEATIDIATWPSKDSILNQVNNHPGRFLRGKNWLRLLSKHLCSGTRSIQHSPKALLEYGLRSGGELSTSIITSISKELI